MLFVVDNAGSGDLPPYWPRFEKYNNNTCRSPRFITL
jgi:hypothetical protein